MDALDVKVPFPFVIRGQQFAAGRYSLSNEEGVLMVRGIDRSGAVVTLTVPTGGRTFSTDNVDALQGAFDELLDELSNQYLLGYSPSNTKRDDTWREIKVEVDGHTGIRARQGYRATPYK